MAAPGPAIQRYGVAGFSSALLRFGLPLALIMAVVAQDPGAASSTNKNVASDATDLSVKFRTCRQARDGALAKDGDRSKDWTYQGLRGLHQTTAGTYPVGVGFPCLFPDDVCFFQTRMVRRHGCR